MARPTLRRFETTILKNKSAVDLAQVPASASIAIYRQGATVRTALTMPANTGDNAIQVYGVGSIQPGDHLTVDTGTDELVVSSVADVPGASIVEVDNINAFPVSVAVGSRLIRKSSPASVYADPLAFGSVTNPLNTDPQTGRAGAWIEDARFDYIVSGAGFPMRLYVDAEAGYPNPTWINAGDYASIQDAVNAVPIPGGTVFIPAGVYTTQTHPSFTPPLVLPTDRNVHVLGQGPDVTTLKALASNTADMVHIKHDYQRLEGLTLEGTNSGTTGRGVVVGRLAADGVAQGMQRVSMIDCVVRYTPSWALYVIGVNDAGASQYSISIFGSYERCQFRLNRSGGGVRIGTGNTTHQFTNCSIDNFMDRGVFIEEADGIRFTGCSIEYQQNDAFPPFEALAAQHGVITSCWFEDSRANPQRYVRLAAHCRSWLIEGCTFRRTASANPRVITVGDPTDPCLSIVINQVQVRLDGIGTPTANDHVEVLGANTDCTMSGGYLQYRPNQQDLVLETIRVTDSSKKSFLAGSSRRLRPPTLSDFDAGQLVDRHPGDVVYNSDNRGLEAWNGSKWVPLTVTVYNPPTTPLPPNPEKGTIIWNDATPGSQLQVWNGTAWKAIFTQ